MLPLPFIAVMLIHTSSYPLWLNTERSCWRQYAMPFVPRNFFLCSYCELVGQVEYQLLTRLQFLRHNAGTPQQYDEVLQSLFDMNSKRGIQAAIDMADMNILLRTIGIDPRDRPDSSPYVRTNSFQSLVFGSPSWRAISASKHCHILTIVDECLDRIDDHKPLNNEIAKLLNPDSISKQLQQLANMAKPRKKTTPQRTEAQIRDEWFTRHDSCEKTIAALATEGSLQLDWAFAETISRRKNNASDKQIVHRCNLLLHMIYSADEHKSLLKYYRDYPPEVFSEYVKKHATARSAK